MCQGAELGTLSALEAIRQPQKQLGMGCHNLEQPGAFLTCRAAENLEDVKMAPVFWRQSQKSPGQTAARGPSCVQPVLAGAFVWQDQDQGTDTPVNGTGQTKLLKKPWGPTGSCHTCPQGLTYACPSSASTWGLFPLESLRPRVTDDSSSDSPGSIKQNGDTKFFFFHLSFEGFAWAFSPGIPVLRNFALDNNLGGLNNAVYSAGGWSVHHMQLCIQSITLNPPWFQPQNECATFVSYLIGCIINVEYLSHYLKMSVLSVKCLTKHMLQMTIHNKLYTDLLYILL